MAEIASFLAKTRTIKGSENDVFNRRSRGNYGSEAACPAILGRSNSGIRAAKKFERKADLFPKRHRKNLADEIPDLPKEIHD